MIRWITENLGTAAWDRVCGSAGIQLLDIRDLVDREGNSPSGVQAKIDQALGWLRSGEKVVVCCDYGMSRSSAIAAGILARHDAIELEEAIRRVMAATGETRIRVEVLSAVRRALGVAPRKKEAQEGRPGCVLVTGASGFIGASLLGDLREKYEVVAPTHLQVDLVRDAVALDLLARERSVDTLIHLAAPRIYTSNESMGAALVMLKNVLDVCVENQLSLIYLGGWQIYSGYTALELRADEALAPCPGDTYGFTKFLCEELIEQCHRRHEVPYLILRSSPVYGPASDRPKFIWNFLQKALRDADIVTHRYANGYPCLDLLHIDDLRRAVVTAVDRGVKGMINLGTGTGTSTVDIAQQIVRLVGSRSRIRHIEVEAHVSNIVMNTGRAAALLDWRPAVTVEQGLKSLIEAAGAGGVPSGGTLPDRAG